jgi:N-dimethylarginine dimethylaminohydrolase
MYHVTIKPETFGFTNDLIDQHPFAEKNTHIDHNLANKQHRAVTEQLQNKLVFDVKKTKEFVPDLVFISSAGLSLPRLPEPVVILPNMKYEQRKKELKYIKELFQELSIKTVEFPTEHEFEGQAEAKWFHNGELLLVGYGFRMTKDSVKILRKLLQDIYSSYGIVPPTVIGVHLQSYRFFHLDKALLETSPLSCIIQEEAFRQKDIERLKKLLKLTVINTEDLFCLNSVIDGENLLTHKLNNDVLKAFLEKMTEKTVVELDTSEYEKSGGSVRSLVFDLFDPRMFKKKKQSSSNPSSPK